jgi:hypothetical protein
MTISPGALADIDRMTRDLHACADHLRELPAAAALVEALYALEHASGCLRGQVRRLEASR